MNGPNNKIKIVFVEQQNSAATIILEINNIKSLVRKTEIGQYIESPPFELNWKNSVGLTKWVILLFLNGQYSIDGICDDYISVYVKMISCQNRSTAFNFDADFKIGNVAVNSFDKTLVFENVTSRWIGVKLIDIKNIINNGSNFMEHETLLLNVNILEREKNHLFYNNLEIDSNKNYEKELFSTKLESNGIQNSSNTQQEFSTFQNNNHPNIGNYNEFSDEDDVTNTRNKGFLANVIGFLRSAK